MKPTSIRTPDIKGVVTTRAGVVTAPQMGKPTPMPVPTVPAPKGR